MKKIFMTLLCLLLMVACSGGGIFGPTEDQKASEKFAKLLENKTGQPYRVAKQDTLVGKYVVFQNLATGKYEAYNLAKFDRDNMHSVEAFLAVAVPGVDIVKNLSARNEWVESGYWEDVYDTRTETIEKYDEGCDCTVTETHETKIYVGRQWNDTSHYVYRYYGGGFRFENATQASRDLEMLAALEEDIAFKAIANKLTSSFSLSTNRAQELAKLVTQYNKLESIRSLTEVEKDKFALDAMGVSLNDIHEAMKEKREGSTDKFEKFLQTAAATNHTTPEQIGRFFDEYVE